MSINKLKVSLRNISYRFSKNHKLYKKLREQSDQLLHKLAPSYKNSFQGTVLVDASWDNPNYWFRYTIIRAALGLASGKEIGLIGPFRRKDQGGTLKRLGINNVFDFFAKSQDFSRLSTDMAKKLCQTLDSPEDILKWSLPFAMPSDFLYDYILKKQKQAFVKIDDPEFINYVRLFLDSAFAANYIIKKFKPDLVISSHTIGWNLPLVWLALTHSIKVVIPFGDAGVFRFWQIWRPSEIYNVMSRPTYDHFLKTSDNHKDALWEIGIKYLNNRLNGKTTNLGAIYAYGKRHKKVDKKQICSNFNWDKNKRIIAVYASNWFDFPHAVGMSNFRDYYDWILMTLENAKENKNVNWLFKGHPCDDWYGGLTLEDAIKFSDFDHIKLADKDWQGASMIDAIDGIITYRGTIGLEATSVGIPVMVADKGWYDDWGFVKCPKSREEYLQLLKEDWWKDMDLIENAILAHIFAGWYWGRPSWQKDFLLEDDSRKWEIYKTIPKLIDNNKKAIEREVETIRDWYQTDFPHYHTYKMMQADEYVT